MSRSGTSRWRSRPRVPFRVNVFIERLWRSVKYEDIYLRDYASGLELTAGLERYFDFYNHQRPHQRLAYHTS